MGRVVAVCQVCGSHDVVVTFVGGDDSWPTRGELTRPVRPSDEIRARWRDQKRAQRARAKAAGRYDWQERQMLETKLSRDSNLQIRQTRRKGHGGRKGRKA